jgi:hypothetical protein
MPENGTEILEAHFDVVESCAVEGWVMLGDDAARSYIRASPTRAHLAECLPALSRPLRACARTRIFTASVA